MLIWCKIINTLPTSLHIFFTFMYICCLCMPLCSFCCIVLHGVLCIMCIMHVALVYKTCVEHLEVASPEFHCTYIVTIKNLKCILKISNN